MSKFERFHVTMPEEIPTATECYRVAPNEGYFPLDATISVFTEEHLLRFQFLPKGPMATDYLISYIDSEPPLTSKPTLDKEVYVEGDVLIEGREFRLASALPILSITAFRACEMLANIAEVELPLEEL